jgi:hypothetical protein
MKSLDAPLVNRVANSGLITLRPELWWPQKHIVELDIAPWLFQGLLLREKDFRQQVADCDWSLYQDKVLCVHCSTNAIIPLWAYMLIASRLSGVCADIVLGKTEVYIEKHYMQYIEQMDYEDLKDKKVIVKGCSERPIPTAVYASLAYKLSPVVQSLMFGEACSTVPVMKKK